jgi:hypothetical protein
MQQNTTEKREKEEYKEEGEKRASIKQMDLSQENVVFSLTIS